MATSQNGWTVNPSSRTDLMATGVHFGDVRSGDVFTVLQYVAVRFATTVERLIAGQCGAYNPRKIEGTNTWSNHASATAIDCNWGRHPRGKRNTFARSQVAAIRQILAYCDGVVRWGGDFTTTVDEMHFEINGKAAAVKALADKIKGDDVTPEDRKAIIDGVVAALTPKLDAAASAWDDLFGRDENRETAGQRLAEIKADVAEIKAAVTPVNQG